jgi:[ribosomal protein S5]-alanine N-acetyltransferase
VLIQTPRFTLRPFRKSDVKSLVKNISDKAIARNMLSIPYPYAIKDANDWINSVRNMARRKNPTSLSFVIEIDGECAGGIGLSKIQDHKAEIGYWLGRAYWGKGIMSGVVKELTRYGFAELGLRRIYAIAFTHNKGSIRVLEKAGYRFEGTLRKSEKKNGKLVDVHLYAKVK